MHLMLLNHLKKNYFLHVFFMYRIDFLGGRKINFKLVWVWNIYSTSNRTLKCHLWQKDLYNLIMFKKIIFFFKNYSKALNAYKYPWFTHV